ncbi:hypothetical protein ACFVUS_04930 [Nocardia sp. NPDC058058]|uniref:hypothetical protein n=1 Tax=Nocardia sp. NPDC058058 TaxID=3346317 RepID=UPI0036DB031B
MVADKLIPNIRGLLSIPAPKETPMLDIPTAVGFLRSDISGSRRQWDEARIRKLACRLGYDLRKIAVFGPHTDRPIHRLRVLVSRLDVDAIITLHLEHLGGTAPDEIVQVADVITVEPQETYARWAIAPMREVARDR